MDKTITVTLTGHADQYRLEQDAYDRLARYLDRAASRLQDDPDRAEVLGDLERSVGDRLDALVGPDDRLVTAVDMDNILEEVGAVDIGHEPGSGQADPKPRRRRLRRIRQGQQIA